MINVRVICKNGATLRCVRPNASCPWTFRRPGFEVQLPRTQPVAKLIEMMSGLAEKDFGGVLRVEKFQETDEGHKPLRKLKGGLEP